MSDKIANTQDRPEEKPLTEQELQFCNLYVNGGLEYAGRPKKCFVEVFGEDTVKNPYASATCSFTAIVSISNRSEESSALICASTCGLFIR